MCDLVHILIIALKYHLADIKLSGFLNCPVSAQWCPLCHVIGPYAQIPQPLIGTNTRPTLTVVTGRRGFVVRFRSPVAARAPPPIPGPASLPQRLVLLTVRHVALATRSMATDVYNVVTTSCNTMTEKMRNGRV